MDTDLFTQLNNDGILDRPINLQTSINLPIKYLLITPSQFNSTEELDNLFRQAIFYKCTETKDYYEGQVIEIKEDGLVLRSKKHSLFVRTHLKAEINDIVFICNNSIKILGKSNTTELDTTPSFNLPKEVHTRKEKSVLVTLNDLDSSFGIRPNFKIKKIVNEYVQDVVKGNVVIENAGELDEVYLKYIKYACESKLMPVVYLIGKVDLDCFQLKSESLENKK